MKKIMILAVSLSLVAIPTLAEGQAPEGGVTVAPPCAKPWQHNKFVRKHVWRYWVGGHGGDFRAVVPTKKALAKAQKMRECQRQHQNHVGLHKELHYAHYMKRQWRFYHKIDLITPYGEWAIPSSIVMCESHEEWTGRWSYNRSSGAAGPYQLLGWGAPYPAYSIYQKAENHMIAARVWAGGRGRSNWVC